MTRNANIDALRAIAVLMVLGRHMPVFPLWTRAGWAGVDLFFVISGYLISGLLFTEWKERGSIGIKRFYIRRGFKIYPAFYFFLALTIPLAIRHPGLTLFRADAAHIAVETLFLQNYIPGVWGHTWSLAVEEHFYLALPPLLRTLEKRGTPADPFRLLPPFFLIAAIVDLVWRFKVAWEPDLTAWLVPTHLRIDGLLFGVLLGYYRHFQPGRFARIAQSKMALAVTLSSLLLLSALPLETPLMHTLGFTVLYLGFGSLLARVVDLQPGRIGAAVVGPLSKMGSHSYSIYLWHFLVARVAPPAWTHRYDVFALYLGASIALGIVMAKLIEIPALEMRERLFPTRPLRYGMA